MKLKDNSVYYSKLVKIRGKNAWKCLKLGELTHLQCHPKENACKPFLPILFQSVENDSRRQIITRNK